MADDQDKGIVSASYTELLAENERLRAHIRDLEARHYEVLQAQAKVIERLEAKVAELERRLGQNSGNSGKPPSRDSAEERQRQARTRAARQGGGPKRPKGKQKGTPGAGLEMSQNPDVIVDHRPAFCGSCAGALGDDASDEGFVARQVVEIPKVTPSVTEHRAHARRCRCGHLNRGSFPVEVRAPVSYGPRVKAVVAYLLARQHLPNRRVGETMSDLFGLRISTGTIDSIYTDASRRLDGFIVALVALLRSLPVLHADETTDRVGTVNCWMHVVSTASYTLIHASATRGMDAIRTAGVLVGYRGVIVHDRLALYWKLKAAKHGICGAHLLRNLAEVALVDDQSAWATGLAGLLVEINRACEDARTRGLKSLAPTSQRSFAARYDTLVAAGLAANPDPAAGRKRDYYERRSFNLVAAFATHRGSILRYMYDLAVPLTNNQGERDLRPTKLHRKISGCFRSSHGAERFAHLRSYLSTTRKNDVPAITALINLFEGNPWMPPQPT
jgi:transposase